MHFCMDGTEGCGRQMRIVPLGLQKLLCHSAKIKSKHNMCEVMVYNVRYFYLQDDILFSLCTSVGWPVGSRPISRRQPLEQKTLSHIAIVSFTPLYYTHVIPMYNKYFWWVINNVKRYLLRYFRCGVGVLSTVKDGNCTPQEHHPSTSTFLSHACLPSQSYIALPAAACCAPIIIII